LLPTPGAVFRHLNKRMNCCTCAPVAVEAIYAAMDRLQHDTRVCPYALAEARNKLARIEQRRARREHVTARHTAQMHLYAGRSALPDHAATFWPFFSRSFCARLRRPCNLEAAE
jgi:hypothetical protein